MEAHGGYLIRTRELDVHRLVPLARHALELDGSPWEDCSVQLSVVPGLSIVRVAYDAPFTYGRRGAQWYESAHSLARLLSVEHRLTVHAYVLDPSQLEQVTSYANGQKVGGERVVYEDVELDEDALDDEDAYEKVKASWPLGRLARILGTRREELVRLPRARSVLVHLDGRGPEGSLAELFYPIARTA